MMRANTSRANFHASSKQKTHDELPLEMWSEGCLEYGRLGVSLYGTRDAAANWEDANAKVLQEHQFERWVGLDEEHHEQAFRVEAQHCGASRDLGKSLVPLNRKIIWQDGGIAYSPNKGNVRKCRSTEFAACEGRAHTSCQRERTR